MKNESISLSMTGAVLGFGISLGAVGCLVTAFDLNAPHMGTIAMILGMVSLLCAALYLWRRGGLVVTGLLVVAAFFLWKKTEVFPQIQALLRHITSIYRGAYGWPVLFPEAEGSVGIPVLVWGSLSAAAVVHTVCRRKGLGESILLVLLPLFSCTVVTDTVPEEGWLFCLMAPLSLLMLTNSVRRESASQSVRLAASMALPVVIALLVLFRAMPQEDYVNRAEPLRQSILTRLQALPDRLEAKLNQAAQELPRKEARQIDLSTLGARSPLGYPVVDVTCDKSGTVYLRHQDFDLYDGLGWTATEDRKEAYPAPRGQLWTARIRTRSKQEALFLPGYPQMPVTLTGGLAENTDNLTEYTISCLSLPDDWRITAYGPAPDSNSFSQYLNLPEGTRQAAKSFLEGLYGPEAGNTEKADAIAALVPSGAAYDLSPETMPQDQTDFALWFLEEADRGYCVHFATAATVLLRAANVPARYVTGYLAEVSAGQTLTVTEENAHAWAEYYEPALNCWLVLEATPGDAGSAPTQSATASTEAVPPAVTETEAPRETASQPQFTGTEEILPPPEEPARIPIWIWIPVVVLGLVPVAALQRSLRLWLRRRRFHRGSPNQQALHRWREAERLSFLLKESPPEALIALAQKARFSQHTITDEELLVFDSHLRSCRRAIEKGPWPKRLIFMYIYAAF